MCQYYYQEHQKFKDGKIISQIVGISEDCDQNGDRVVLFEQLPHIVDHLEQIQGSQLYAYALGYALC